MIAAGFLDDPPINVVHVPRQPGEGRLDYCLLHLILEFQPYLLPIPITYTSDLVLALSEANAAIGELSGLARHLPHPQLLIAPYIRREAVLSSRIEGTKASLSDLLLDEVRESNVSESADVQEVRNYVTALF